MINVDADIIHAAVVKSRFLEVLRVWLWYFISCSCTCTDTREEVTANPPGHIKWPACAGTHTHADLRYEPYHKGPTIWGFKKIYSLYTPAVEDSGLERLLFQTYSRQWDQILWHMDLHWSSLYSAETKPKQPKIHSKCCTPCPHHNTKFWGCQRYVQWLCLYSLEAIHWRSQITVSHGVVKW